MFRYCAVNSAANSVQERLGDIGGTLAGVDKRQKVPALHTAIMCFFLQCIR